MTNISAEPVQDEPKRYSKALVWFVVLLVFVGFYHFTNVVHPYSILFLENEYFIQVVSTLVSCADSVLLFCAALVLFQCRTRTFLPRVRWLLLLFLLHVGFQFLVELVNEIILHMDQYSFRERGATWAKWVAFVFFILCVVPFLSGLRSGALQFQLKSQVRTPASGVDNWNVAADRRSDSGPEAIQPIVYRPFVIVLCLQAGYLLLLSCIVLWYFLSIDSGWFRSFFMNNRRWISFFLSLLFTVYGLFKMAVVLLAAGMRSRLPDDRIDPRYVWLVGIGFIAVMFPRVFQTVLNLFASLLGINLFFEWSWYVLVAGWVCCAVLELVLAVVLTRGIRNRQHAASGEATTGLEAYESARWDEKEAQA